jgi:ubiquinone/menaquinone biosynthesis C-methylase UbiE
VDYDKTDMPRGYDLGRRYSPAQLARWLAVISISVAKDAVAEILDLGCGTGRYSGALAEHFDARVIALDPSDKMLAEARRKAASRVGFVRGRGESLPLASASLDMIFMSMVFHHFDDPAGAVRECRRVLRPGGVVCLRSGTAEQIEAYAYVPFFPEARAVLQRSIKPRASIESTFASGGFGLVRHEPVRSEAAPNWNEYAARLTYRADSILVQLSDGAFERGLKALRQHARVVPPDEPVVEPIDFFVFRPI